MKKLILSLLIIVSLVNCKKDKPVEELVVNPTPISHLIIRSEGFVGKNMTGDTITNLVLNQDTTKRLATANKFTNKSHLRYTWIDSTLDRARGVYVIEEIIMDIKSNSQQINQVGFDKLWISFHSKFSFSSDSTSISSSKYKIDLTKQGDSLFIDEDHVYLKNIDLTAHNRSTDSIYYPIPLEFLRNIDIIVYR